MRTRIFAAKSKPNRLRFTAKVQGNITVGERCELKSKCTLQGDLKAARLVIEEGATFIGKSEVTSGMSVTAAKPVPAAPKIVRNDEPVKRHSPAAPNEKGGFA